MLYASEDSIYPIDYFKSNFDSLYLNNYDGFWTSYYYYQNKNDNCKDIQAMVVFLDFVKYIKGNAEVSESFHEYVEKYIMKDTECIFNAALELNKESLDILIKFYLSNSLIGDEEGLKKQIQKYLRKDKYKEIKIIYEKYGKPE